MVATACAEQIVELQGLDQIGVPDQRSIAHFDVRERGEHFAEPAPAFVQGLGGAEYRGVALHDALHVQADVGSAPRTLGVPQACPSAAMRGLARSPPSGRGAPFRASPRATQCRAASRPNTTRSSKRVRTQAIRAMHRYARRLADRHQPGHHFIARRAPRTAPRHAHCRVCRPCCSGRSAAPESAPCSHRRRQRYARFRRSRAGAP